jgi:hypothetical protein
MQTPVFGYLWHFLVWQLCTYILPCVGVVVQGVEALFSFTVRGSLNPSVTSFMYRNHDTTPDADAEVGCYIAVGSEQFSQICCGPHYLSVCASEFSSSVCFSSLHHSVWCVWQTVSGARISELYLVQMLVLTF